MAGGLFLKTLLAVITFVVGSLLSTNASAGIPIPYGESGKTVFVSETELRDDDGSPLALCTLWVRSHVAYVGYWGSQEYVLAPNNCTVDWSYEYPAAEMIEDRVQGLIPARISNEPEFSLGFAAYCFSAWAAVALIGLIWANGALADRAKVRRRRKLLGDVHPYVERMVTVMTHAARSDGNISDVEIDLMRKTVKDYAGTSVTIEDIVRVINMTPKIRSESQFKDLGRGLDADGRQKMFHAGLAMIAADGVLEKSERKWLSRLGTGLGYKARDLREIFEELNNAELTRA